MFPIGKVLYCKREIGNRSDPSALAVKRAASTSVNSLPKEHQNLAKISFAMLLYSNVCGLRQASGELCRVCMEIYPLLFVCQKLTFMKTSLIVFVLPVTL